MYRYEKGQNGDAELLAWYLRMIDDGDLDKLYGALIASLSDFLQNYTDPLATVLYDADERGWWVVGWYRPFMGTGSWGMWVRPDKRGSLEAIDFAFGLHALAFETFETLTLATMQEPIVVKMTQLGYNHLGVVPGLFGHERPGHLMFLTRDAFASTRQLWKDKHHGRSTRIG